MKINDKTFLIIYLALFAACSNFNTLEHTSSKNHAIKVKLEKSKNKQLDLEERLTVINAIYQEIHFNNLDSISLAIIAQKSNTHYQIGQTDSAFIYDKILSHGSKITKNNFYAGLANFNLAIYYKKQAKYDSAFHYYNQSKNFYLKENKYGQVGRRYLSMAVIQQNQNDYFGSKETVTDAIAYLQSANDAKYLTSAFSVLATNHRKLLNFEEAIKYFKKAIHKTKSSKNKLAYKNNLAATYIDSKQYDLGNNLLEEIAKDSILKKNSSQYARVLDNLAYVKWLSNIDVSEGEFQKPLELRSLNKDQRGQIASYTHLGEFYSKTNPTKAKTYFDSVIQISKKIKITRAEKDALKFLMQLQPKNVKIRDRYVYLQDSLYAQELKVKTQFAKYKYDDKITQKENSRLENENAKQELKVAQQQNQKTLTYAIGIPILLLLGFLTYFFVQRSKRLKTQNKTAKLEATYETEAELSRKLHDDFGGKLNHAMLLLQSNANNEEVLNIVDRLYNQSREFSREINDVDTGPNFKNFLFGMMGNYCKNKKLITTGSTEIDWLKLSSLSKKTLFKVLQELMINMQKHSNASLVSIAFEQSKKKLKVTYADDGDGASNEELNLKNGLWNTEKRIKAIGGTIIFDSEKGQGFEAQIEIPN